MKFMFHDHYSHCLTIKYGVFSSLNSANFRVQLLIQILSICRIPFILFLSSWAWHFVKCRKQQKETKGCWNVIEVCAMIWWKSFLYLSWELVSVLNESSSFPTRNNTKGTKVFINKGVYSSLSWQSQLFFFFFARHLCDFETMKIHLNHCHLIILMGIDITYSILLWNKQKTTLFNWISFRKLMATSHMDVKLFKIRL